MKSLAGLSAPIVAAAAVLIVMLVRVLYFYFAPDETLIGVVADDAFYYVQMARHRVSDGFWTFDGSSPATGFHLLYGYFLAAVYALAGDLDWRQLYLLVGVVASATIALSAFLACRTVEDVFARDVVPIAVAPYFTAASLSQSTAMVESWLVLLFAALTVVLLTKDTALTLSRALGLMAVGILGSLARTDYGMLPGVLFFAILIGQRFQKNPLLIRISLILAGAIVGILIVLVHNYGISGQLAQASAQVKLHWSAVQGHTIRMPILLFGPIAFPFFEPVFARLDTASREIKLVAFSIVVLALALLLMRLYHRLRADADVLPGCLWAGCALTIVGYITFYRYNSAGLQIWYAANVLVPIAVCLSGGFLFIFRRRAAAAAVLGLALYVYTGMSGLFAVTWPHQAGMMQAALFLRESGDDSMYGAWNAGMISYFSEKRVVNIDGLANDDVLPFITSNALLDYIKSRNIEHVIDYDVMITNANRRARGGYEDVRTETCLRPGPFAAEFIRVFDVIPGCL